MKKVSFVADCLRKSDHVLEVRANSAYINLLDSLISKAGQARVTIERVQRSKSLPSNNYFHVLVEKLAKDQNISRSEMKINLKMEYGVVERIDTSEGVELGKVAFYSKHEGLFVEMYDRLYWMKSVSSYSQDEMNPLINGTINECLENGINIEGLR